MLYKSLIFPLDFRPSPDYDLDLGLGLFNFMLTSAVKTRPQPSQFFGFEKSRSHFQDASKLSY